MSKSIGNVIDPNSLADQFGSETLRYYLVRDIVTGKDSDFDADRLVITYNTELANNLGNLCNRALNMSKKSLDSIMEVNDFDDDESKALRESMAEATAAYKVAMDNFDTATALYELNKHVSFVNGYAERTQPWTLAKDETKKDQLATVLYHMVETCAQLSILLSPVVPEACAKIQSQLQLPELANIKLPDLKWGLIPHGHKIGKPKPVFPRIQIEE